MRIGIVGAGISGLTAAWRLHGQHEITVFEAGSRPGGHAHTVSVRHEGRDVDLDTGFVVFNEKTYPGFTAMLRQLGVATRPTTMGFSVQCQRTGLEYCGSSLGALFAQKRNLLRPWFLRMLRDIVRFNREAKALAGSGTGAPTLRRMLDDGGFGDPFRHYYLVPMVSAIWSTDPPKVLDFPASFLARFMDNHGLLDVRRQLSWRVIEGGSSRYVNALTRPFQDRIRVGSPVRLVARSAGGVRVVTDEGASTYDEVILAVHSDQALRLLESPSRAEREVLGALPYQSNEALLHTDTSLLPKTPRARASWNYHIPNEPPGRVVVTYDMSRLQGLATKDPLMVTLNWAARVDPSRVLLPLSFSHPVSTIAAEKARACRSEISGVDRIHYCGAYWGNGFHEDGVQSGLWVASQFEPSMRRAAASGPGAKGAGA